MRQAVDWIAENDRENINVLSPLNVAWKNNVMNKNYRDKLNYLPIKPISLNKRNKENEQKSYWR